MIEAKDLTKRYGPTLALDHVTYLIRPGEVVGLLGPNGAGKTTMLKMITGYLPPSEGSAQVAGFDVQENSIAVRERIGYLPETNPLYEELAVYESLEWTARLRRMPSVSQGAAIRKVIEICGLQSVVGKDIGHLSKGYRQRVGLAQAILHDPEILILDEPTSGLDPNQQQEVRQLIQTLKQKKTVLLSTHILSEAQSACDRVLIIHKGKIVADGAPGSLGEQATGKGRLILDWKGPAGETRDVLSRVPGITSVSLEMEETARARVLIETEPGVDVRETIFHLAVEKRWPILQMTPETVSLEEIFRQLTVN